MRGLSIDSRYRVVRNLCGRDEQLPVAPPGVLSLMTQWYGPAPAAGTDSLLAGEPTPVGNRNVIRKTWTAAGSTYQDIGFRLVQGANTETLAVSEGATFTFSIYVRPSWSSVASGDYGNVVSAICYDASGATLFSLDGAQQPLLVAGTWTRIAGTWTIPAGVAFIRPYWYYANSDASIVVGSTLDATALMATEGPTLYAYADGNSPNWRWDGTPNASTSRGLVFVP